MMRTGSALLVALLLLPACPKKKDEPAPAKPAAASADAAAPTPPPAAPDAAVAVAPDPAAADAAPGEEKAGPHELSFGGIYEGQDAAGLIKILGEPGAKGEGYEEGATGLWLSSWSWPDKGAEISMSGKDAPTVHVITLKAPSTLKTAAGIGIGSTAEEVKAAYGKQINKKASRKDTLIIGDEYGGTFFTLADGKVSEIFQGAAAE